jgi:hypothetical protein
MQVNRNDGEELPRRSANPSPPITHVHGLGESRALRVDLEAVQLPWLADEIDTLRSSIESELVRERARYEGVTPTSEGSAADLETEVHRRAYQLHVLAMIREQIPLEEAVAAACVASPWDEPNELAQDIARITAPVTVVGPARGMLVLIRGATRNVGDALAEALHGPRSNSTEHKPDSYAAHWPEWLGITPAVASRLGDMASAAAALTSTYIEAVAQQSYSFDPEYDPIDSDELW